MRNVPDARFEVLLVEDSPGDAQLVEEALAESGSETIALRVVGDGRSAIDYLGRRGAYGDAPRPQLILLDLNLPQFDGRDVLRAVKSDDDLKHIPVIVLTTSDAPEDIETAYRLQANCYVTKPNGFDEFVAVVRSIENFWTSVARIPR